MNEAMEGTRSLPSLSRALINHHHHHRHNQMKMNATRLSVGNEDGARGRAIERGGSNNDDDEIIRSESVDQFIPKPRYQVNGFLQTHSLANTLKYIARYSPIKRPQLFPDSRTQIEFVIFFGYLAV